MMGKLGTGKLGWTYPAGALGLRTVKAPARYAVMRRVIASALNALNAGQPEIFRLKRGAVGDNCHIDSGPSGLNRRQP